MLVTFRISVDMAGSTIAITGSLTPLIAVGYAESFTRCSSPWTFPSSTSPTTNGRQPRGHLPRWNDRPAQATVARHHSSRDAIRRAVYGHRESLRGATDTGGGEYTPVRIEDLTLRTTPAAVDQSQELLRIPVGASKALCRSASSQRKTDERSTGPERGFHLAGGSLHSEASSMGS